MLTEFYFEIQYFNFDWKLQSHFFIVWAKKYINSRQKLRSCNTWLTVTAGKTVPYTAVQNLKICQRRNDILHTA